jgi:cysteine-rich repeat protein
MRSLLLASIAALVFPACTQDITGAGTGDDQQQAVCGDGVVGTGEACDDGNTVSGDGCSATCQNESVSAPRVDGALDKPAVTSELGKTETLNLTLTSVNGFAGTVTIAAALTDATAGTADPAVVLTVPGTADLSADGTAVVPVTLTTASDASGTALNDNLTFTLTSSAGTSMAAATVAIANIFTITFIDGTGGVAANHAGAGVSYTVKRGAIIRFHNADTTTTLIPTTVPANVATTSHVIHGDGAFPHQDPRTSLTTQITGDDYDVPTIGIAPGSSGSLGCHDHAAAATYSQFTVM